MNQLDYKAPCRNYCEMTFQPIISFYVHFSVVSEDASHPNFLQKFKSQVFKWDMWHRKIGGDSNSIKESAIHTWI